MWHINLIMCCPVLGQNRRKSKTFFAFVQLSVENWKWLYFEDMAWRFLRFFFCLSQFLFRRVSFGCRLYGFRWTVPTSNCERKTIKKLKREHVSGFVIYLPSAQWSWSNFGLCTWAENYCHQQYPRAVCPCEQPEHSGCWHCRRPLVLACFVFAHCSLWPFIPCACVCIVSVSGVCVALDRAQHKRSVRQGRRTEEKRWFQYMWSTCGWERMPFFFCVRVKRIQSDPGQMQSVVKRHACPIWTNGWNSEAIPSDPRPPWAPALLRAVPLRTKSH